MLRQCLLDERTRFLKHGNNRENIHSVSFTLFRPLKYFELQDLTIFLDGIWCCKVCLHNWMKTSFRGQVLVFKDSKISYQTLNNLKINFVKINLVNPVQKDKNDKFEIKK